MTIAGDVGVVGSALFLMLIVFTALGLGGCVSDPRYNRGATPTPCLDGHTPTMRMPCNATEGK